MKLAQVPAACGIHCRPYGRGDRSAVRGILHSTGFLGEELAGKGLFEDKRLFALVNTEGYLRFQPSFCFVAVDDADGTVAGYIIGTGDSRRYEKTFRRRMYWRIAVRCFLVSWWRHPESFRHVLAWARAYSDAAEAFFDGYPAHLHINVLPTCQRRGIGELLIRTFEATLRDAGVAGVHLITSNRNSKALPFYAKLGYDVLAQKPGTFWQGVEGHVAIVFGKRL